MMQLCDFAPALLALTVLGLAACVLRGQDDGED
jgi:hypothetical protein